MTVAACPSCQESVTVPVDATPDCVVRCPLCHEEFKLEAFLNQLPPALIVLDGGSGFDHGQADSSTDPDASSSNVLGAFAASSKTVESGDSVPAFDFTPGSVSEDGEESAATTSRYSGRPKKNPTAEVLKIVAGALLAIPAAQIILWLVPGDWKRDLLGIGPAVSRVVPWVVPEKFRAPEFNAGDDPASVPAAQSNATKIKPSQARPRANNGSALAASRSGTKNLAPQTEPDHATGTDAADGTQRGPTAVTPPAPPQKADPAAAKETAPALSKVLVPGVRGAPQFDLADLRTALETALQASVAWDTNPDQSEERRTQLTERFYEAFARLSETVTYPPPRDPGTGDLVAALSDVLETFAREPRKLAMIGNQTSAWLDLTTRPNQGIFMFGTVRQITSSGQLFETELELAALQKRTITVVSRVDPRHTFAPGDRILMLGAIVDQPEQNLLGYEGKEPMVVMGGFPVLLR